MLKKLLLLPLIALLTTAASTTADAPPTSGPSYYNIRAYGATGDGKTLDQDAVNKAIDAASSSGGGTVYVGPGHYLCGSIHLKSNIHLLLDMGAEIVAAPQSSNAYDQTEDWHGMAYQDGGHTYFHNSLIWGENLDNISITGPGRITGGIKGDDGKFEGLVAGDAKQDTRSGFSTFNKGDNPNTQPPDGNANPDRTGNKAIALKLCKNVTLRDFTIFHGGHFAILVTGVDGFTMDNVTIDTQRDGIDIDCCRNVMVANSRINSPNDDGLCPKSTDALGENRICENMVFTNCQVTGWEEGTLLDGTMKPSKNKNGRFKLGTEASGGFRNITLSNCTFRGCRGMALEEVDGGIMENITISNVTMMDVSSYPIYITTGKRNRTVKLEHPSLARNILISNVIASGIDKNSGIQIMGLEEQPIENVRLENIRFIYNGGGTKENGDRMPKELGTGYPEPRGLGMMPAYGLIARHVKGLELANIKFSCETPEFRSPLECIDVSDLEIDNFKAQTEDGVFAAKFQKVSDVVIRNSPVLEKDGAIEKKDAIDPASPDEKKAPKVAPATTPAAPAAQ